MCVCVFVFVCVLCVCVCVSVCVCARACGTGTRAPPGKKWTAVPARTHANSRAHAHTHTHTTQPGSEPACLGAAATGLLQLLRQSCVVRAAAMLRPICEAPDPVSAIGALLQVGGRARA